MKTKKSTSRALSICTFTSCASCNFCVTLDKHCCRRPLLRASACETCYKNLSPKTCKYSLVYIEYAPKLCVRVWVCVCVCGGRLGACVCVGGCVCLHTLCASKLVGSSSTAFAASATAFRNSFSFSACLSGEIQWRKSLCTTLHTLVVCGGGVVKSPFTRTRCSSES